MKELIKILKFIAKHPLAGKHKFKAFYRFFTWQFSQMFYAHEVAVPFIGNTKILAKKGLTGATGNIYTGLHEFNDMGFLLHFLREGDLFFDIGANIGSYTLLASGYKKAKSVSFEPIPSTYEHLLRNIRINNLSDIVQPYNIGIGNTKTTLFFTRNNDTVNHIVLNPPNTNNVDLIQINVENIDTISKKEGTPQLIKIDVEGFETEVINGMPQSLKSGEVKAIIIELNGSGMRYGFEDRAIHNKLVMYNFLPYSYDPFKRLLTKIEDYGLTNTLYIKDIKFARNRVENAKKVEIFSEMF